MKVLEESIARVDASMVPKKARLHTDIHACSFLTYEKATTVNTFKLESYLRGELAQWDEWLPERPIDMLGGELAMEALRHVDWRHVASLMLDELHVAG